MKIHYFFIEKKIGNDTSVIIETKELLHQWKRVFRFTPNDCVVLLDNSGFEYWGTIKKITADNALVSIDEKRDGRMPKELSLTVALPKKDKFEWILEKATELGVSRFFPIISERSEKKDLNIERAQKIIKEAAEQSEHACLPTISAIQTLEEALKKSDKKIVLDPRGEPFQKGKFTMPLNIFIGPEGGWSEQELELFKKEGIEIVSLGEQILKTETAAIAIASLVLL